MGRLESPNFDFGVVNFDTMKLIFSAKVLETLITQDFLDIEKERKLQYLWYHNFRSYVVEATGFLIDLTYTCAALLRCPTSRYCRISLVDRCAFSLSLPHPQDAVKLKATKLSHASTFIIKLVSHIIIYIKLPFVKEI